ncbi:MAG TPA: hypothetical protein VN633_18175 [Bryobacteraceae bacterium]|nr:hypothetical protein [Bryobacteraceae bacterium]
MKWRKQMTAMWDDERVAKLVGAGGVEGLAAFGLYCRVLDIVADQMDAKTTQCSVTYPVTRWSLLLSLRGSHVRHWLEKLAVTTLLTVEWVDSDIRVTIPNLLKYRDEYSKKSGQTPNKEQNRTDTEEEQNISTPKPKLVSISDNWFEEKFWPLWPVKENKIPAKRAAAKLNESDREAALAGVIDWAFRIKSMERPIHAATWLNGRRWEDEKHKPGAREPTLFSNFNPSKESFAAGVLRRAQERIERGERPL